MQSVSDELCRADCACVLLPAAFACAVAGSGSHDLLAWPARPSDQRWSTRHKGYICLCVRGEITLLL